MDYYNKIVDEEKLIERVGDVNVNKENAKTFWLDYISALAYVKVLGLDPEEFSEDHVKVFLQVYFTGSDIVEMLFKCKDIDEYKSKVSDYISEAFSDHFKEE